jgi:hypothetical protein
MYHLRFIIILSALLALPSEGQNTTKTSPPVVRKGLFYTASVLYGLDQAKAEDYSMLSLGTMFGVSYLIEKQNIYKVQNGVVVIDRKEKMSDRIVPSVYAFPSLNLVGKPGKSLSMIVPVNINPSSDVAVGVGLSYGFNTFKTVEVGLTAIAIWSEVTELNEAQKKSLETQQSLPPNEPSEFPKTRAISIGIGIYVLPLFK